ncbi:MAG: hypothetical protein MZU97_03910 [Bacillus subtilis]|nr:hypothetical protein [Bacillus subtilis]
MKKLIVMMTCLMVVAMAIPIVVHADQYLSFQDIVFENDEAKLLEDYQAKDYTEGYQDLAKRAFIGWRHKVIHKQEPVEFIADTKLKITNNGFSTIKHTITLTTKIESKFQITASGDIGFDIKGDIKKFKGALDAEIKTSIQYTKTTTTAESYEFVIIVDPGTYVTIKTRGEGIVSNGVARHYLFWIMTNQGGWETFTITTEYFEIVKEKLR